MESQTKAQDLKTKITNYLEELARETDVARKSESMQKYLESVAKFHQYSSNNIWLILMARPDATNIAGFHTWKKMNRFVKKGEHGIPIFAPMIHKEDPDVDNSPKILNGFRIVYVFDVSQTEGEPLPPIPDWKSPEKNAELTERLLRFAEYKGIKVTFKDLPNEIQGTCKGKEIEIDPNSGTKTCLHEIAHSYMHWGSDCPMDRATRELQAESVAYVVSKYFGLAGLQSPNYIALHGLGSQNFVSSMAKIQEVSREIIGALVSKEDTAQEAGI
jgi:hypothetical protein